VLLLGELLHRQDQPQALAAKARRHLGDLLLVQVPDLGRPGDHLLDRQAVLHRVAQAAHRREWVAHAAEAEVHLLDALRLLEELLRDGELLQQPDVREDELTNVLQLLLPLLRQLHADLEDADAGVVHAGSAHELGRQRLGLQRREHAAFAFVAQQEGEVASRLRAPAHRRLLWQHELEVGRPQVLHRDDPHYPLQRLRQEGRLATAHLGPARHLGVFVRDRAEAGPHELL